MSSYFAGLVDFVGAHPQVSFLAVFLLALSEAVPVIGTVVPGSSLIIAISALATAANITLWAPIHVFPGVLVGLAIAFGGARAPELSVAAIGVLILAWIAWNMIKRKTAVGIMDCPASQDAPGLGAGERGGAADRARRATASFRRRSRDQTRL